MVHRREILQIGCSSFFGLGLSGVLGRQALAAAGKAAGAKSVVLAFLSGGGSHIDMFDPKPDSPETKGEFGVIATKLPGVYFGDRMPLLAARADKFAIVRSMSHKDNRHLSGSHNALTGAVQPFRGTSNLAKNLNRDDWPCYGSTVSYLRPRADRLPSQVTLPYFLTQGAGLLWPGQHAGFLGPDHDPFILKDDPNKKDYKVSGMSLIDGVSVEQFSDRRKLLQSIDDRQAHFEAFPQGRKYTLQQELAYAVLTSSKLKTALDINAEPAAIRDRYYHHQYGQTLLLARRLVQLEMPVIQCNMGGVQTWDTHVDHFPRLKNYLPMLDRALSTFLDDLQERGLLDQTLVICVGEFGRTPKISPLAPDKVPGRHHWAPVYSALFAGAGVKGGQIIGRSDNIGGHPVTAPFHPNDMGATIYQALGIDPASMIPDQLNRPRHVSRGEVMDALYTGAPT